MTTDAAHPRQAYEIIDGPAAWTGPEMAASSHWRHDLTAAEVADLRTAMDRVWARGLAIEDVGLDDFALPVLAPVLAEVYRAVVHGHGFMVLRGLPVDEWSMADAALAYWGIGLHLGLAVPQNAAGHLIGHVRDLGYDPDDPTVRIYTTTRRQPYHTDSCDIVGLLCLQKAKAGGLSALSSSVTIYNEMLRRRPDLVEVLMRPFVYDRKGEVPPGKQETYEMAAFFKTGGLLTTILAPDFIYAAQRFDHVPRLSAAQREALDMMQDLADSDDIRLDLTFEPGDIQLVHNHQVLHSRTDYEDHADPALKRHLLRLWLATPAGRELPAAMAERYGTVALGGMRGGIRVAGARAHVNLVPS